MHEGTAPWVAASSASRRALAWRPPAPSRWKPGCGRTQCNNQAYQGVGPAQFIRVLGSEATAVKLQSLEAVPGDAAVRIEWRTASELDNLGFHLYRSDSPEGPWTRITPSLIPGLGSSPTGASYSYPDGGLVNGRTYFYEVEDIDTSGQTKRHGPVSVVPATGADGGGGSGDSGGSGGTGGGDGLGASGKTYGETGVPSLRVIERGPSYALLELRTPGFRAVSDSDGSVHLEIPGFELPQSPGSPAVPVRRAFLDALAGRGVHIASVQTEDLIGFAGLRVATEGMPDRPQDRADVARLLGVRARQGGGRSVAVRRAPKGSGRRPRR